VCPACMVIGEDNFLQSNVYKLKENAHFKSKRLAKSKIYLKSSDAAVKINASMGFQQILLAFKDMVTFRTGPVFLMS
jgi:hypothetical protein